VPHAKQCGCGTDFQQIAATALIHDLTLVTRHAKRFENLGVCMLNPFGSAGAEQLRE
jgi:predicted nucleic acid-binding protein